MRNRITLISPLSTRYAPAKAKTASNHACKNTVSIKSELFTK